MSRRSCWLLAVLMLLNLTSAAPACPGSLAIGLPLLFGSDEPTSPWPAPTSRDAWPVVDLALPADLEEAQEFRDPPARQELAKECLKAWRQLIRERRYEFAPAVAAKAAALDPSNLEAQHAVIVSQVLRSIDKSSVSTKSCAATACGATCAVMDCQATGCLACPVPACAAEQKVAAPKKSFELKISLTPAGLFFLPGSATAFKYLTTAAGSKAVAPTATKPCEGQSCAKPGTTCVTGACPAGQSPENGAIVAHTIKHLFPGGLLACDRPAVENTWQPAGSVVVATPVASSATKATTGFAVASPGHTCPNLATTEGGQPTCHGFTVTTASPVQGTLSAGVTYAGVRTVNHAAPAPSSKRVTIKTAAWVVECDRVILMDEREMIVDGNVSLTMRQRDVTVHGSRVRVNLNDSSIPVDGKYTSDAPLSALAAGKGTTGGVCFRGFRNSA